MKIRFAIIGLLTTSCLMSAIGDVKPVIEQRLAGIRLGMRPREVTSVLGDPTAVIVAQPPLGPAGPTLADNNTLVYLYKDREIELTATTTVSTGTEISGNAIHDWAYIVRVARLALNQQQLIYRINDTYSVGIVVTGDGNEARVTDIIACSLLPLARWPNDPKREFRRNDPFFRDMFTFKYGHKRGIPAGTSRMNAALGARLDEVLKAHGWPEFFIPFTSQPAGTILLEGGKTRIVEAEGGEASGGSAEFAFDTARMLRTNFTNNAILLYPDSGLALTLMNHLVVRLQIGQEMIRPSMRQFIPVQ